VNSAVQTAVSCSISVIYFFWHQGFQHDHHVYVECKLEFTHVIWNTYILGNSL